MRVVVLIPAHNEEASIGATIESVLAQTWQADRVVVIPNGCTDRTAEIASQHPVTVLDLPRLAHGKSEALNRAWSLYGDESDMIVTLDGDSTLGPDALAAWRLDLANASVGGSSGRFAMTGDGVLVRLQRNEFATYTDVALRRGSTSILAGAGCAMRTSALREIAARSDREGPWTYASATEDYELTLRIRENGWTTIVSPGARVFTDAMPTVRALWGQRMKWQTGIVSDLLSAGITRYTWRDWLGQVAGAANVALRLLWIVAMVAVLTTTTPFPALLWLVPLLVTMLNTLRAARIPNRDRRDFLVAATFLPNEVFVWLWMGWFTTSWFAVIRERVTGKSKDRWAAQYAAEGK